MIVVDQSVVSTLVACTSCTWRQLIEPRMKRSATHAAAVAAGLVHVQLVHFEDEAALRNMEQATWRHAEKQSS